MRRIPCFLFLVVIAMNTHHASAQDVNPLDVKIIPPGPEASSIGKFVDIPVSHYTGIPKIDIPIYTLKSYELSLPISLSYHASGIKMEELASFVGAGWTLNAGGIVSRTIRGLNDEYPYKGYFAADTISDEQFSVASFFRYDSASSYADTTMINSNNFDYVNTVGTSGNCDLVNHEQEYKNVLYASRGGIDLEPDLFFFTLPDGQSGKFVFSRNGQIYQIPQQYVNMEYTMGVGNTQFDTWTFIGHDGTRYIFAAKEFSDASSECIEPSGLDAEPGQPDVPEPANAPTSWRLSTMISASGQDTISFEYEGEIMLYEFTSSYTTYYKIAGAGPNAAPNSCATSLSVTAARLSRITSSAGYEVEFVAENEREDIDGGNALEEIVIKYKDQEIRRFELGHDYVTNGSQNFEKMLMLTSVQEKVGPYALPAYEFEYYDQLISGFSRKNPNVDHWGLSNGATTNSFKSPPVIYDDIYYHGDNRDASLPHAQQWSLKKITYPTGGTTEYEYELHDYSNVPGEQTFATAQLEELASIEFALTSDENATYYGSDNFTLSSAADVIYVYTIPEVPAGIPADGCGAVLSATGFTQSFVTSGPSAQPLENLAAGVYTLNAEFEPGLFNWYDLDVGTMEFYVKVYRVIHPEEAVLNNQQKGGGLRIKKITSTGDNTIVKSYGYTQAGSTRSSGKVMTFPSSAYLATMNDGVMDPMSTTCIIGGTALCIARTATSNLPLTHTQGSPVGYDRVVEYLGTPELNNGYSVYEFTNKPDRFADQPVFPIVPQPSYAYKNGALKAKSDYTSLDRIVLEEVNTYRYVDSIKFAVGIKIAQSLQTGCKGCPNRVFAANYYDHSSERVELGETLTRIYDINSDNYQEQHTTYHYNEFDQVVLSEQTIGTDKKLYTAFEYNGPVVSAITGKYSYYAENTSVPRQYRDGQAITYNSFIKPTSVEIIEPPAGAISGPPTGYVERLVYDSFDEHGNVESYRKDGSELTRTSIIWGYDGLFPMAEVLYATPDKIAYTGFEHAEEDGGWVYGVHLNTSFVTGSKSYSSLGTTPVQTNDKNLDAGKYVISFWSTNSNFTITYDNDAAVTQTSPTTYTQGLWTLYTIVLTITGSDRELKISRASAGDIIIDDLRLYPEGSLMKTFTFDPVNGMTSSTDANNFSTYYFYDEFHRLYRVKDFEGNILKQVEYHYERDND